jgi:predicted N-acyltransferase
MTYQFDLCDSVEQIGKERWDALFNSDFPFTSYEFFDALEKSGATSTNSGWQPLHLTMLKEGECIALVPLYIKHHSYGEYVFDWAWADAYHRHGVQYYPKLLTASPFSPVSGPKYGTQLPDATFLPLLSQAIKELCHTYEWSSWHGLFIPEASANQLETRGMITRHGCQYHWFNQDYDSFDTFLDKFTSRKRKAIRKERKKVAEQGIRIQTHEGAEVDQTLIEHFYQCYQTTYLQRGRQGYLNIDFFQRIFKTMPENIVLFTAYQADSAVAAALCFKDQTSLYGRYWGALGTYDCLHFETCYYTGIEYCITQGLNHFDPGAQGEHKIQRGFEPIRTFSSHFVQHDGFEKAIQQFAAEERDAIASQIESLTEWLPFKN